MINALRCFCPLREEGCEWEGEYGALASHTSKCSLRPVKCSEAGCRLTLSASTLESHVRLSCDFKIVPCPREKCSEQYQRRNSGEHAKSCPWWYCRVAPCCPAGRTLAMLQEHEVECFRMSFKVEKLEEKTAALRSELKRLETRNDDLEIQAQMDRCGELEDEVAGLWRELKASKDRCAELEGLVAERGSTSQRSVESAPGAAPSSHMRKNRKL